MAGTQFNFCSKAQGVARWSVPFSSRYWAASPSCLQGLHLGLALLPPPHLPFQIIKAYLDYSLLEQLAIQSSTWYKYEIMAMEMILNLPLKAEGIEIMAYMADTLGSNKFLMGHLDLAIDLGKGWLSQTGHADISDTRESTEIVFSSGSRAQKMWGLLRNPYKQYKVLCWLSRSLCLKIRYLS